MEHGLRRLVAGVLRSLYVVSHGFQDSTDMGHIRADANASTLQALSEAYSELGGSQERHETGRSRSQEFSGVHR